MDYRESLAYLGQIQEDGAKFSLDNIQVVIDHFPFDLRKISFVQVGGTNGKGSTSHGIASVLLEGGYRVGLFTSPHLFDLRERIALNGEWISPQDFADCLTQVRELTDLLLGRRIIPTKPSFFEHMLLTALVFFCQKQVDFAVLEVGLGGRLDATTAIPPVLSVITNVSYDHMKILGNNLKSIAAEKAGIVKPGVPLVCACQARSTGYRVIRQRCLDKGAPFEAVFSREHRLSPLEQTGENPLFCYHTPSAEYRFTPGMNGRHQALNAATIIRSAEVLNSSGKAVLPRETVLSGIARYRVPGRMEWFGTKPPILIDGGHNVPGIKALTAYLDDLRLRNVTLVFGVLRDKQYARMIRLLLPYIGRVILIDPLSHRAKPAAQLLRFFPSVPVSLPADHEAGLREALSHEEPILITGSLYLIGYMREKIELLMQHSSMEVPS